MRLDDELRRGEDEVEQEKHEKSENIARKRRMLMEMMMMMLYFLSIIISVIIFSINKLNARKKISAIESTSVR